ncbi:MAG: transposase [Paludibacter sp.]
MRNKKNGNLNQTGNFKSLDNKHFSIEKENDDLRIHAAVVYAVVLKRTVRVVFVEFLKNEKTTFSKVYFSTNIKMEATEILEIYQTRFQIEFVYRDAKQQTSLTTCQARNKEKLDFHFNISLTAVNVAKIVHWYSIPIEERKSFSLSDIKTINHNTLLL